MASMHIYSEPIMNAAWHIIGRRVVFLSTVPDREKALADFAHSNFEDWIPIIVDNYADARACIEIVGCDKLVFFDAEYDLLHSS